MLMYPTVRQGQVITEPTSVPFQQDSVFIHDDNNYLPDFSPEVSCYHQQQQPRLRSPFQYHPDFQFVSPPSSAPSSPTFSSPSSSSYPPATTTTTTTAVASDYPAVLDGHSLEAPSMTPASSYNPSLHFQQSPSPSQSYLPQQYSQQYLIDNTPMLAQQPIANNQSWEGNLQLLGPAQYQRVSQQKTSPSASSSSRSAHSHRRSNSATVSKLLPTPVQTPVQNSSFLAAPFQNFDPSSQDAGQQAELALRRAVIEQHQQHRHQQHRHQHSDYSLAPSVSSVSHNSPVTPQTGFDELDDSKAIANDYGNNNTNNNGNGNGNNNNLSVGVPKLNRTISDIYQDELYNPAIMSTPQISKQSTGQNLLNPYRSVFADRLQAASQGHMSARSQSPAVVMNRERSPFRQGSPHAADFGNPTLQQSQQMTTSIPMSHTSSLNMGQVEQPNTMSPKDAVLDFNEGDDAAMPPLFPSNQGDFNLGDALGLRRESNSSMRAPQNFVSMESFPSQYVTQATGLPQQYAMAQPHERRLSQQQQQVNNFPEFPTSITLGSASNDVLPTTEMASPQQPAKVSLARPANTSSDSGTYTCTYHGCSLRFETPAKLQKHKREAHRQTTPGGHLIGRDTASRNSQAGPHKCERINPATGKSCNSVFSRPYDLTRHEDTIHNARKLKVRCHLCTEEKTFSRNDALTRHMRVVHPEVDWPGKQRRRGRE